MILKQRDIFLNRKVFVITENGLEVQEKGILSSNEYFVDFDNIGSKRLKSKTGKKWWLIGSLAACMISLLFYLDYNNASDGEKYVASFYLVVAIACLIIFYFTFKRTLFLLRPDNSNGIEFLFNKPNKVDFEIFISEVVTRRDTFLVEKYGNINDNLSYEQNYNNLLWLLNNYVIAKVEFKLKKDKLDRLYSNKGNLYNFKGMEKNN